MLQRYKPVNKQPVHASVWRREYSSCLSSLYCAKSKGKQIQTCTHTNTQRHTHTRTDKYLNETEKQKQIPKGPSCKHSVATMPQTRNRSSTETLKPSALNIKTESLIETQSPEQGINYQKIVQLLTAPWNRYISINCCIISSCFDSCLVTAFNETWHAASRGPQSRGLLVPRAAKP